MKALITGGNGFVGSHLQQRLCALGDVVRVLDRVAATGGEPPAAVEYIEGGTDDQDALRRALEGVDLVYHLASSEVPSTSNLDPIGDVQGNLIGTLRLLGAMVEAGVRRIVFLSSGGTVYGNPEVVPTPEDHPQRPRSSYGVVKVAIEHYLALYAELHHLVATVLRPSNAYGPRQGHTGVQGVVGTTLYRVLHGQPIVVFGNGTKVKDYLYVTDLVELICLAGRSEDDGIYNAGSGVGYSVNEIIQIVREVTGIDAVVEYAAERPGDVDHFVLDSTKARERFGWIPRVGIRQGIALHWRWLNDAR